MLVRSPAASLPPPHEAFLERVPFGLRAPALLLELLESLALLTPLLRLLEAKSIHHQPMNDPQGLPVCNVLRLHRLELRGRCQLPRVRLRRDKHTLKGGRRTRLLMGRPLRFQRALGFAHGLRVPQPKRAPLLRVLLA